MAFTETALNEAADAVAVDTITLHSGDPGAAGDANVVAGTTTAITLAAAAGGIREMAEALDINVPAGDISHYTLWDGATLKAKDAFDEVETYAAPGIAKISTAVLSVFNAVAV